MSKRETPSFEISPLLLDLDAEKNPYVRLHEENDQGKLAPIRFEKSRRTHAERMRVRRFEEENLMYERDFSGVREDRYSIWRISDYDVLSFMLDPPPAKNMENTGQIEKIDARSYRDEKSSIMKWNGIPEHMQAIPARVIPYVLRRRHVARHLHPGIGDSESLGQALLRRSSAPDPQKRLLAYERIIGNVIQTPEGAKLVSGCSQTLGTLCGELDYNIPSERLLSFLNNVVINLSSHGLPISPALLKCAYEVSYDCHSWPMLQKYMGMLREKEHEAGPRFLKVLNPFKHMMTSSDRSGSDSTQDLLSIYGLLTGRSLGDDISHPSFHESLSYFTRTQFTAYLACLARLGAFRSMWYIWHAYPEDIVGKQASGVVGEFKFIPFSKAVAFAQAITSAITLNSRFVNIVNAPGFTHVAEERYKNCELELQAIMTSANLMLADNVESISENSPESFFANKKKVAKVFENKSLQKAISTLQSYILEEISNPDFKKTSRGTKDNLTEDQ